MILGNADMNLKTLIPAILMLFAASYATAWTRSIDFNDGTVGAKAETQTTFDGAAGRTTFSNDVSLDGSNSAKMTILEGETGFGYWGGVLNFPDDLYKGDQFWASFYMYVPKDFVFYAEGNGALKFLRVRTRAADPDTIGGFNDFQIMDDDSFNGAVYRYIKEGAAGRGWRYIGTQAEKETLLPRGKWFKVEIGASFDSVPISEGGTAYFRLWIDDKLVWNGEDVQTLTNSPDWADSLFFFTYWNGKAPQTQSLYIDNIIMTSDKPNNYDSEGHPYIGSTNSVEWKAPPAAVQLQVQ
ncbi:heparin lyase I family protein [Marinobacteraceae bacterium S3BR75-40.1]